MIFGQNQRGHHSANRARSARGYVFYTFCSEKKKYYGALRFSEKNPEQNLRKNDLKSQLFFTGSDFFRWYNDFQ